MIKVRLLAATLFALAAACGEPGSVPQTAATPTVTAEGAGVCGTSGAQAAARARRTMRRDLGMIMAR